MWLLLKILCVFLLPCLPHLSACTCLCVLYTCTHTHTLTFIHTHTHTHTEVDGGRQVSPDSPSKPLVPETPVTKIVVKEKQGADDHTVSLMVPNIRTRKNSDVTKPNPRWVSVLSIPKSNTYYFQMGTAQWSYWGLECQLRSLDPILPCPCLGIALY